MWFVIASRLYSALVVTDGPSIGSAIQSSEDLVLGHLLAAAQARYGSTGVHLTVHSRTPSLVMGSSIASRTQRSETLPHRVRGAGALA